MGWDDLNASGMSLTATVFGLLGGLSEDIEIHVRKLTDEFQYYLKPTRTRFAAFCFRTSFF